MNIVRLVSEFDEEITGGLQPNCYYISREQAKQGHKVFIFALTKRRERQAEIDGIKIFWVKKPPLQRFFAFFRFLNAIKKAGVKPDVIHSMNPMQFGWLFPVAKSKFNCKYCLSVHGSIAKKSTVVSGGYRMLCLFLAKKVDLLLPVAEFVKRQFLKEGIAEDKIKVIGNGIDFGLFNKTIAVQKSSEFTVLFVGRFAKTKGLSHLIKAIALLKNKKIRLELVGGTERDDDYLTVISLIKKLELKKIVSVKEPVPYRELPKIYQSADLLVLPSIAEGMPKTILEAMASSTPAIASEIEGTKELIQDNENGLLFPPANGEAISEAIEKIMNSEKLRKKIIANGLKTAKRFDWGQVAKKYGKAFIALLE